MVHPLIASEIIATTARLYFSCYLQVLQRERRVSRRLAIGDAVARCCTFERIASQPRSA
jgi:hypothetical protein